MSRLKCEINQKQIGKNYFKKSESNNHQWHFLRHTQVSQLMPRGGSLVYLLRVLQVQARDARPGWGGEEQQTQRDILQGLTGGHRGQETLSQRREAEAARLTNHRAYSILKERNAWYFCPARCDICSRPPETAISPLSSSQGEVSVKCIQFPLHQFILGERGASTVFTAHWNTKRHAAPDRVRTAGWGATLTPTPDVSMRQGAPVVQPSWWPLPSTLTSWEGEVTPVTGEFGRRRWTGRA